MRLAAALLLAGLACLPAALPAAEDENSQSEQKVQQQLDAVRANLRELAARQQALLGEREAVAAQMRDADLEIAAVARELDATRAEQASQNTELERLRGERDALQAASASQRATLATLVRSIYAAGRHEQLKLLLAQDSIERLHRGLIYYRYLQRDRLGQLKQTLAGLAVRAQQEALAATEARLDLQAGELASARARRAELLARLEKEYADAQSRSRALGRDESALKHLLQSIRDIFADIPRHLGRGASLAQQRGKLPRPAIGRLRVGYAGTLPDGRPSRGWWIETADGGDVRAIAHGRVAFAEWMKGYGLLVIIEHGDDYMSLYAGNDALRVEPGDWVEAGQALAQAGRSGGFDAPGVYFELRRKGQTLDPSAWLSRR